MMKFLKHNRSRLWSVTVLLALALLVTLLAACTNTPGGTDDLLFYGVTTVEYLIGSITIQQLG